MGGSEAASRTLVVGSRGLLGRAVLAELRRHRVDCRTVRVPWEDDDAAVEALVSAADAVARGSATWRLVWCAGAGVIATPAEQLESEVGVLRSFLERIAEPPSAMFLASSAGGVYAGSPDGPPFTERSRPVPLAPYGHAKLATEQVAAALAERGTRVVIGRIANLYGPGQDLTKPQGLVSQLCLTQLSRQPLGIYTSMDSLRDYVYVGDAAAIVVASLDRVAECEPGRVVTKVIASGRALSIGALVGESQRVFRRRPFVTSRAARAQVRDLRVRSVVWTDLDALASTPFVVGVRATAEDIAERMRTADLRIFDGRAS
jgi:UDP-glucose 4-epimerase